MPKKHKLSGFTIVELLIVIVVIAILATISIVAFNGIQARAENTKTLAAAESYYKAIKMYEVDNGEIPQVPMIEACLGEDYPWDYAGNTSGSNQCTSSNSSYYKEKASLNSVLKSYITPLPMPSVQAVGNVTTWSRGITYVVSGAAGTGKLLFLVGLKSVSVCPTISGQPAISTMQLSNGLRCSYEVGDRIR